MSKRATSVVSKAVASCWIARSWRLQTGRNAEIAEAAHDFKNILDIVSMLTELAQIDLPVGCPAVQGCLRRRQ